MYNSKLLEAINKELIDYISSYEKKKIYKCEKTCTLQHI